MMKIKNLLLVGALLCTTVASATTLVPVPLLNPTGSTSGQIVLSNGPVTAPGWGNVAATSLAAQAANTVVANVTGSSASPTAFAMPSCSTSVSALNWTSGTGFTCGGSGFAALTGATFTGASGLSYVSPTFTINDSTGANAGYLNFNKSGVQEWSIHANSSGGLYIDRYVSGVYADTPFSISSTNGTVGMGDGIVNTPISGSSGSFTTLAASGTVSGAGINALLNNTALTGTPTAPAPATATNNTQIATTSFAYNLLAAPPAIGGTTPNAGTFTTLKGNSLAKVYASNTSAQSIPTASNTAVTGWTTGFDVNSNFTASTGTFTAPATSYYAVSAELMWGAMSGAGASGQLIATVYVNGAATNLQGKAPASNTTQTTNSVQVSGIISVTAGQTIVLNAFQNTGSSVALTSAAGVWLSIYQLP